MRALWQAVRERVVRVGELFAEARLGWIFLVLFLLAMFGGTSLWLLEGKQTFDTPFDALWWAIVTMTSVGYGDYTPQYVSGRLVAMVVMFTGVMAVGVITARISSVFVTAKIREGQGLQDIVYSNHLIIAGWFSGAERVVDALIAMRDRELRIVLMNNLTQNEVSSLLERYKELQPKFVRGDITQETVWKRAGVTRAWSLIILPEVREGMTALHSDQRTLLATLAAKKCNRKVPLFVYALEQEMVAHLQSAGADKVVVRDTIAPMLLASHALRPGVPEVLMDILNPTSGTFLDRIEIPRSLIGKPVRELESWAREKHGGLLIALITKETVLEMTDILTDDLSSIDAFIKRKFEEAGRKSDDLTRSRLRVLPNPDNEVGAHDVAIVLVATDVEATVRGGGA
ncbi:MAG: ion channel [bacterium]